MDVEGPALMRRLLLLLVLLFAGRVHAHIGSPNVIYEGLAGPYPVRVIVRPPGVVPGLAEISVRILQGSADRVTVLPVRYDTGSKGSPAPDVARPVKGEANLYSAELWLMTSGAHSIFVNVEGVAGKGTTIVPINSVATTRLEMPKWYGAVLLAFGIFLAVSLVTIVGSAVRESMLQPGEVASRRRPALISMGCAVVVLSLLLLGGRKWWNSVDSDYRNNRLYKPEQVGASIRQEGGQQILRVERLDGPRGRPRLIPDHGKLMHLFLVRTPGQDAFAHLHPERKEAHIYESVLPELPEGEYRLYADVTHESGFTQTLTAKVTVPKREAVSARAQLSDADDAWLARDGQGSSAKSMDLSGGLKAEWLSAAAPLSANRETSLTFRIVDTNGMPAVLESYLGMQGHAVIEARDGTVFTHLHPFGNISMASQQRFVERERKNRQNLEVVCGLPNKGDSIVFPYEFPRPGDYRIWVQVKVAGEIRTAVFDASVPEKSTGALAARL
jgi:hypothetical protein